MSDDKEQGQTPVRVKCSPYSTPRKAVVFKNIGIVPDGTGDGAMAGALPVAAAPDTMHPKQRELAERESWTKGRNIGKSEHTASCAAEMVEAINEPPRIAAGPLVVSTVSEAEASSVESAMVRTVAEGVVVRTQPATVTISNKLAGQADNGLVLSGRDPGSCHVGSVVRAWHPGVGQEVKCIVMHDNLPAAFPVGVRIDAAAALGWYKNVSGEWCKASSPEAALAIAKALNTKEEDMAKGNVTLDVGPRPRAIALRAYGNVAVVAAYIPGGHTVDPGSAMQIERCWERPVCGRTMHFLRFMTVDGADVRAMLGAVFDMMQIRKGRGDYYMEMDLPRGTEIRLNNGRPDGDEALRSMMADGSAAVGFFDHRDEFPFKGADADKPTWVPHAAAATDKPTWVPFPVVGGGELKWRPYSPATSAEARFLEDRWAREYQAAFGNGTNTPMKINNEAEARAALTPEPLDAFMWETTHGPESLAIMKGMQAAEEAVRRERLRSIVRGSKAVRSLSPQPRPALFWQDNTGALCCGDPPEGFLGTERILSPEAVCERFNAERQGAADVRAALGAHVTSRVLPRDAQGPVVLVVRGDTREEAERNIQTIRAAGIVTRHPIAMVPLGRSDGFDMEPVADDVLAAVGLARLTDAERAVVEAMRKGGGK